MTAEKNQEQAVPAHDRKVGRTIRLTPELNDRLVALAEHLGVSVNAYMSTELGKAIARDEITYHLRKNTNDMTELLQAMMLSMGDLQQEIDDKKKG